jgi:hypothetical protein
VRKFTWGRQARLLGVLEVASIRRTFGALVLAGTLVLVSSCAYSPSSAAKSIALTGVAEQLRKLQVHTQLIVDAETPLNAVRSVMHGDAGLNEPTPLTSPTPFSPLDAATGYAIFHASTTKNGIEVEAAVWAQGESGGGFTGDQSQVYLCVRADVHQSATVKRASLHGITCPRNLAAILTNQNRSLVNLGDVPSIKS